MRLLVSLSLSLVHSARKGRAAALALTLGALVLASGCEPYDDGSGCLCVGAGGFCDGHLDCAGSLLCNGGVCGSGGGGSCLGANSGCSSNGQCCSSICLSDTDRCADPCSASSQCVSECCAPLQGGGGACAPSSFCH